MTIQRAVEEFRDEIEEAIRRNGEKGKTSKIRSSKLILKLHEAVKHQLIAEGVEESKIYPPLNTRKPELKLAGYFKRKDQDICVIPNLPEIPEILQTGQHIDERDRYGHDFTEQTLTINVRSQVSSIAKNTDTMFERAFSEAFNLHKRCPKMVLGDVFMVSISEYDSKAAKEHSVVYKAPSAKTVKKYIKSFQSITGRVSVADEFYKYESFCLLLVDFSTKKPTIYHSTQELIDADLIPPDPKFYLEGLTWNDFSENILRIYRKRFPAVSKK